MNRSARSIIQVVYVLSLTSIMLMLTGCILEVIQPESVSPGETFGAEIKIMSSITGTHALYLGIRLPTDWEIVADPVYADGSTFTYSPTVVSSLMTHFEPIPNTTWWGWVGPDVEIVTGNETYIPWVLIRPTLVASGVYTLNYVDGIYTDTLTWSEVSLITMTVTADKVVYLPIVTKE